MVRYPIVVRSMPGGVRKISFPDFPGCNFCLKPKEGEFPTEAAFQAAISAAALAWLVGTPARPGWIPTRLRQGHQIVRPGSYPHTKLDDPEFMLEADPLPAELETGLEFNWLYFDLNLQIEDFLCQLDVTAERYIMLMLGLTKPNHHERAKLRNFQQRSQTFRVAKPGDMHPEEEWYAS